MTVLLLADPSPALRLRVLTELLDVPPDDPEVVDLVARRAASAELAELVDTEPGDLKEAAWLLCRLGYAGLDRDHPRVRALAEQVFARQRADGAFPLRAFRTEGQRLDDGSWPSARAAGQPGYIAGYRRLPGSPGCRVNTQAAVACLVGHPVRGRGTETRRALDLLLRRETRDEYAIGTEVARLRGRGPAGGFFTFYARFDLAYVLDLASRAGASAEDPRVADLVEFLTARRGPAGLWEHPEFPELSRWLTLEILLSLRRLATGDWAGAGPRMPFRPFPGARRRA